MKVVRRCGELVRIRHYPLGMLAAVMRSELERQGGRQGRPKISLGERNRVRALARRRLKASGHFIALQLFSDDGEVAVIV